MSDKNNPQASENPNELNNWIEEVIIKKHVKYYEYRDFYNIQSIGHGQFGKVYRSNWKNSEQYLVLKSLCNFDNTIVTEIVHEVIINYKYNKYVGQ